MAQGASDGGAVYAARRAARVACIESLGPGLARVDLEGAGIGAGVRAGRFAMLEARGRPDCVLLRPFSYFLAKDEHRAAFLVKATGKGTAGLVGASPGDAVAVLGPLGSAFPEADDVWAVAGGVGAAPFGPLAARRGFRVLFGARTSAEAGFAGALTRLGATVELATDDGSAGFAGTVVELLDTRLERQRPRAVYVCGPGPMMAAAALVARRHGVECQVSLEERMGCGIGVCRGCAHADATGGWRCICVDGPVYDAREIYA